MHELSIAYSLVNAAENAIKENQMTSVSAVHIQLGALSGVVKDALLFSYDIAVEGTRLEGSRLEIKELPVVIFCEQCQQEQTLPSIQRFRCPVCDTPSTDIRQGKELDIVGLEIPDHETEITRT